MRVLNCFTRRGLLMEGVWCAPVGDRHRATVMVNAEPITIEQIIRELESTVGVDSAEELAKSNSSQSAALKAAEITASDNGSTTIKLAGPPEENRQLLTLLGA